MNESKATDVKRFFVLAYGLTWAFPIPFVIAWHTVLDQTLSPWVILFLPAPFGPTFAALVLVGRARSQLSIRVESVAPTYSSGQ